MLAPNAQIAGRYRVVRTIGRGGMGIVYEVEHNHTGQHLALKVLLSSEGVHREVNAEAVERFKREARASGKIKSENVVRVTDADVAPELDGAPFFVMEMLEGTDLRAVTANRPASRTEVVEWLQQAARGLARAHDLGIVHRDLKPENLFLTHRDDGAPLVKILDFGIAKTIADANVQTQSGQILGTPMYMAPEQAMAGGAPITTKTDLYAVGLIAFRLLTGEYFWKDGSLASLVGQLLYNPIEPPTKRFPSLGADFDAWFLRACARDPADRFDSAPEQIRALAVALGVSLADSSADRSAPNRVVLPIESSALGMAKTYDVSTPAPALQARTLDSSASAISTSAEPIRRTGRLAVFALVGAALVAGALLLTRKPRVPDPSPTPGASSAQPVAASSPSSKPIVSTAAPVTSPIASIPSPSVVVPPHTATTPIATAAPVKTVASTAPTPSAVPSATATPPPKPSTSLDPLADQK